MNETSVCPIWGTEASIGPKTGDSDIVDSPRAGGRYFIAGRASEILKYLDERLKARLTSWLIEQRQLGEQCPKVYSNTISVEAKGRQDLLVQERADRLLRYIERQIPNLGAQFRFSSNESDHDFTKMLA